MIHIRASLFLCAGWHFLRWRPHLILFPLTTDKKPRKSIVEYRGEREAAIDRSFTGDAGFADPADACARPDAWVGRGAADSTGLQGCVADWPGVALPRPAPAGIQGMDSVGLGQLGKQPPREVLLADRP